MTENLSKNGSEVQVLLPLLSGKAIFDYAVPDHLDVVIGDFVLVSFRKKEVVGIVWSFVKTEIHLAKLKKIINKYNLPTLTDKHLRFIKFIADYTMSCYGAVLKMMMPLQSSFAFTSDQNNEKKELKYISPNFSDKQQQVIDCLTSNINIGYSVNLLDGVTGSGKTEVYFAIIDELLQKQDKQVLVLLPEIMLTNQLIQRFESRFGFIPAKWHSHMTPAQKKKLWLNILVGKEKLVIGARSALFLPYCNLALVIVDEEHDMSYKQEDGVIYNARDAAVACGYIYKFPVILSSATPSIETLANVKLGKYNHLTLPTRFGVESLPNIEVIDMRQEKLAKNTWISSKLLRAINSALQKQKQVMLFLNRRGYAPITLCRACGHKFHCHSCSAYLVSHADSDTLACHHCGFVLKQSNKCISCDQEESLIKCGPGVERIAEEIKNLIPLARVLIITKDTVIDEESAQEIIASILAKKVDIVIGTQMISKGHDFPDIEVVGIIDADLGLMSADLRSAEKTYQLLTQMSGRAGRREQGRALIQTYYPDNQLLNSLLKNDRDQFTNHELQNRKILNMPPFGKLSAIILSGMQEEKLRIFANEMLKKAPVSQGVTVLGPVKAPLAKIRKRYRYRFLVKSKLDIKVQKFISYWLDQLQIPSNIRIKIDIDPYNFL